MLQPPFITQLCQSRSILIAGCGGGFDVFCGLPLFFALQQAGKTVHLANLSFSFSHGEISGRQLGSHITRVDARSRGNEYYFPEGYLAQWLCRKRMDCPIYCFRALSPKQILDCYKLLKAELNFDTVVLVDGGVDSVLRGDEAMIGTPVEDMCSVFAVQELDVEQKIVLCLGFGAERDVNHGHALQTFAHLVEQHAFLGALALTAEMPEVKLFKEAVEFVFFEMKGYESVILSSVLSALEGKFGDHHRTRRTHGTKLWINPLMPFYWAFSLSQLASSVLYLDTIREAETLGAVSEAIREFRKKTSLRPESVELRL